MGLNFFWRRCLFIWHISVLQVQIDDLLSSDRVTGISKIITQPVNTLWCRQAHQNIFSDLTTYYAKQKFPKSDPRTAYFAMKKKYLRFQGSSWCTARVWRSTSYFTCPHIIQHHVHTGLSNIHLYHNKKCTCKTTKILLKWFTE